MTKLAKRFFEDVVIGDALAPFQTGPLTVAHLVRWCGASENWHRIHYDKPFAVDHDKLPGPLINGSLKQQFLARFLRDWATPAGWVWRLKIEFRAMNVAGEALTIWGEVTGLRRLPQFGLVDLRLGIRNEAAVESAPTTATVALPYRNGKPLPYPFIAPDPADFNEARS